MRTQPKQSLRLLYQDEALSLGQAGPVLVSIWDDVIRSEHLGELRAGCRAARGAARGGLGVLAIVRATHTKAINEDTLRAALALHHESQSSISGEALVFETGGMASIILKLTLREVYTSTQRAHPYAFFDERRGAIDWLAKRCGGRPEPLLAASSRLSTLANQRHRAGL